jgi:glycosyltransferase involved in cell wall biosynthesis
VTKVLEVLGRSAGGIARHVAEITAALDGTDGLVVDVAGPLGLPVEMPKPILEVDVPDGPIRGHRAAVARLRSLIRDGAYDVVHAHGLRAGIDAGLATRSSTIPTFVTVHNLVRADVAGRLKAPLYRSSERLAVRLTDRTFAVSHDIAEHLRATSGHPERVEVLHLGIAPSSPVGRSREEIRAGLGIGPSAPLVVTASRLSAQKAVHVLLAAVTELPEVTLAILGEGPLESEIRATVERSGLSERVHLLGFRSDVHDWIAAADIFCLSSVWEGVPLAAQEAIVASTPVVATDVGGMRELVTDRRSGRLVPKNDPAALAEALREVLTDRDLGERYTTSAKEDLERNFSTERMLDRLRLAYTTAPAARGTAR